MRILVHPAPRMVTSGEGVSALSIKTPKFSSFAQFTQAVARTHYPALAPARVFPAAVLRFTRIAGLRDPQFRNCRFDESSRGIEVFFSPSSPGRWSHFENVVQTAQRDRGMLYRALLRSPSGVVDAGAGIYLRYDEKRSLGIAFTTAALTVMGFTAEARALDALNDAPLSAFSTEGAVTFTLREGKKKIVAGRNS